MQICQKLVPQSWVAAALSRLLPQRTFLLQDIMFINVVFLQKVCILLAAKSFSAAQNNAKKSHNSLPIYIFFAIVFE